MQNLFPVDPFFLKVIISFIVGGVYIGVIVTHISERVSPTLGGILAGMPSTVLISLLFIAWTQSSPIMRSAIPIMPVGLSMSAVFLMLIVTSYNHGKLAAFGGATLVWLGVLLPFVFAKIANIFFSGLFVPLFLGIAIFALNKVPSVKPAPFTLRWGERGFRMCFAGSMIASSVVLAKLLGPLWGGLVASFPAASFSALVLLTWRHGVEFAASVIKAVPYGIISNIAFLIALYLLIPALGTIWAFAIGLTVSGLLSTAFYLKKRG